MKRPNYKKIYTDMIIMNFPCKLETCHPILKKSKLNTIDIINLQKKLFGNDNMLTRQSNQRHKSYDKGTILKILDYQKIHRLNNTQLAEHFKLSRNTVTKWKRIFL